MALEQRKCIPCEEFFEPLDEQQAREYLIKVPGWKLGPESRKIERSFVFKNFAEATDFVNKIASISEEICHHPDIQFGWGYANITISTHSISGLSENDFTLAEKINNITK